MTAAAQQTDLREKLLLDGCRYALQDEGRLSGGC